MRVLYLCNAIYKYNTYMCINVTTIIELCFIVFLQRPANWQAARGDVFRQGWWWQHRLWGVQGHDLFKVTMSLKRSSNHWRRSTWTWSLNMFLVFHHAAVSRHDNLLVGQNAMTGEMRPWCVTPPVKMWSSWGGPVTRGKQPGAQKKAPHRHRRWTRIVLKL